VGFLTFNEVVMNADRLTWGQPMGVHVNEVRWISKCKIGLDRFPYGLCKGWVDEERDSLV
jgi:hypothetical protein